ncbi:MAG: cytochrome P450, partial [Actinomycetota bacterium]|nr:cytochrome P450 [Actinomycetota bacterium]
MTLPPGPSVPPVVQTARWLFRPIEFMDACRRRHGDAFSVMFLGFETPMVMISDPEAIKALYKGRESGLPPGRTLTLESVMGSRSVLLLEGADHLSRRKAMLPAFHGERMREYESLIADVTRSEIATWPVDSSFPVHPRMQGVTLEVILRAVFGITDSDRLEQMRGLLARMLADLASPRLQLRVLLARRFGRHDPMEDVRRQGKVADDLIQSEIDERRASSGVAERDDILSMLMAARF